VQNKYKNYTDDDYQKPYFLKHLTPMEYVSNFINFIVYQKLLRNVGLVVLKTKRKSVTNLTDLRILRFTQILYQEINNIVLLKKPRASIPAVPLLGAGSC
jgi:hypothetical protein